MNTRRNVRYNPAGPHSLSSRVATRVRHAMFARFIGEFSPTESDEILDLGVTSDQSYPLSNYFEQLYPYKNRITAAGIDDDAKSLEDRYRAFVFAMPTLW